MMKLSKPNYSFEETISACIESIPDKNKLKDKIKNNQNELITNEEIYNKLAANCKLCCYKEQNLNLSKDELVELYDSYFLKQGKPARKIYDAILSSVRDYCPFCGVLAQPSNLDHFLPKSKFAQLSVLPVNLIPICRDCNLDDKRSSYARQEADQILHPYLDKSIFFEERWISARYESESLEDVGVFIYEPKPPEHWQDIDQQRVVKHFEVFQIAKKYQIRATEHLGTILRSVRTLINLNLKKEDIIQNILQPEVNGNPFINHWRNIQYQAFIDWFEQIKL